MFDNYLIDVRHLIDLNKTTILVDLAGCIKDENPIDVMETICEIVNYSKENYRNELSKLINWDTLDNLIKKLYDNKNDLCNLNDEMTIANQKRLKENAESLFNICTIYRPFKISCEELIALYHALGVIDEFGYLIPNIPTVRWRGSEYYNNTKVIKDLLQERLAAAVTEKYSIRMQFRDR